MNILTSSYTLDISGTPTFTLTMYKELVKRGHKVAVYSPLGGKLETEMNAVRNLDNLPIPDVILAQHIPCAVALRNAFPNIPMIFYSHGFVQAEEQPPEIPVDYFLAINEEVRGNLQAKGVPADKITIVRDLIDTERFKPLTPINPRLQNVLFISNYKKWKNYKTVEAACKKLNLTLKCCGSPYGRSFKTENEIGKADLVISWARGILEAMSCGRAALSFDRNEGDGYITKDSYFEARMDNFSGRHFKYVYNGDTLAEEMLKYDPNHGKVNRSIILKYHNVVSGVDQILEVLNKYANH